jgi:TPR repeat protein
VDQGNADAQCDYGLALQLCDGVPTKLVEGAKSLKLSADQGNALGQCNYDLALQNGDGVPKNVVETKLCQKAFCDAIIGEALGDAVQISVTTYPR